MPATAERAEARAAWLLSAPALLGLALFLALPFALAVALSFTNLRLGSPLPLELVGLEQYARVLADARFRQALGNNLVFAAVVVPVQTACALGLALLLHGRLRARALYRAAFFLPVVFPLALVAVLWVLLYAPGPGGLVNRALALLTLGHWTPRDFLHDPAWALPAIMVTSIWQGVGFQMVILLAGLQGIPRHLYEAAALDGAGRWARFRHVTLPGLRNPLVFTALVTTILAFRLFDQVRIMTRGGPAGATTTVVHEIFEAAYVRAQAARASAMTVIFFLIVLAITLLQRRLAAHRRWAG